VLDRLAGFQHIAVTYDSEYAKLYLNAELIGKFESRPSLAPSGQDYFIGGARDRFQGGIGRGELDELWIYEGALSQSQIRQVFLTNAVVPEPNTMVLFAIFVVAVSLCRRIIP